MRNGSHTYRLLAVALAGSARKLHEPGLRTLLVPGLGGQIAARIVRFSGNDWQLKTSAGSVGPGPNAFAADGVRVDRLGHFHLGIVFHDGRWISSEVILQRSLTYGEYRFTIQDAALVDTNAVLGMFCGTRPRPANLVRFELPQGRAQLSFLRTPGRPFFHAVDRGKVVREPSFPGTSPTRERKTSGSPARGKAVEAVIEHFDFLPFKRGS